MAGNELVEQVVTVGFKGKQYERFQIYGQHLHKQEKAGMSP